MEYIYCYDGKEKIIYDIEGNKIDRTKEDYPYSYSPITTWIDEKIKADTAIYSDRLYKWDSEKYNRLCKNIWGNENQYFDNRKHEDIEKFLSLFLGKEIKLARIREECNQSSGYPYWRFDFKQFDSK